MKTLLRFFIILSGMYTSNCFAEGGLDTDWMQASKGSSENNLDAKVLRVQTENQSTIVDVEMPVKNLANYETVVVVGRQNKQEKKSAVRLVEPLSWLHGDDNKPYGLRFRVEGVRDFEFRIQLRMVDDQKN